MSDRDWSTEVTDPETIRTVLGSPPPPLSDSKPTSVLVDEREASATLRFFAFAVPAGAAHLWQARGHNAIESVLVCIGVKNFEVDGWSGRPTTVAAPAGTTVVLAGRGSVHGDPGRRRLPGNGHADGRTRGDTSTPHVQVWLSPARRVATTAAVSAASSTTVTAVSVRAVRRFTGAAGWSGTGSADRGAGQRVKALSVMREGGSR